MASSKSYVVLLSGTNVTVEGRTVTLNAGAPVPDGAEHIEHLLSVGCIGEVGEESDRAVSEALVGPPAAGLTTSAAESEEVKPARKGAAS